MDCAQLWDGAFGVEVLKGMCVVRSSRVGCRKSGAEERWG